jgi:hypothetical protein
MTKNTTVVWASFPSHHEAREIKERLTEHGFARNSIEIYRQPDGPGCDVAVHTSERNMHEVERLLHASGPVYAIHQMRAGAIKAITTNPLVIGGGIALAGLVAYALLPRNRQATLQSIRELPKTFGDLPDKVASAASAASETVRDLPEMLHGGSGGREANRHPRA